MLSMVSIRLKRRKSYGERSLSGIGIVKIVSNQAKITR